MIDLLLRLLFGAYELVGWVAGRGRRTQGRRDSTLADVDRVNAWLRTQPNSNPVSHKGGGAT